MPAKTHVTVVTVVFDNYDDPDSMNKNEQLRNAGTSILPHYFIFQQIFMAIKSRVLDNA